MHAPLPPAARHILCFAQTLRGGGVERAMLRLAGGWIEAGRRVSLVIGDVSGPLSVELPPGIELHVTGGKRQIALRALPVYVTQLRPDLLFCPGNHYSMAAGWTKLHLGAACPPIVAKISNRLVRPDHNPVMTLAYRFWLGLHRHFVDQAVALTPTMHDEAIALMGLARSQVSTIPNPPAPHPAGSGAPVTLPPGRFVLGLGRLTLQKRWDRLVEAFAALADPDLALLLLGEGEARPALAEQVRLLGIGDRVWMPGYAPDPVPALRRAAVVALTSDYEGAPGVLREALALGTPVVTTDSTPAVRETVTSPSLGTVVPVGDQPALVSALEHWLAPEAVRPAPVPEIGADSVDRYLRLFDSIVAGARRAAR